MKLSEARRKLSGMYPDPMQRLVTDWPNVPINWVDLGETWEQVRWGPDGPEIDLHRDLNDVQARTGLTHALGHLDLGEPCEPLRWQIERRVEQATARWLIPDVGRLATVLAACDDLAKVAWEFNVPPFVIKHRIHGLTDDEWVYIEKHREAVA